MDTALGLVLLAALAGIGSHRWRAAIRAKRDERREDRELRRKYDF